MADIDERKSLEQNSPVKKGGLWVSVSYNNPTSWVDSKQPGVFQYLKMNYFGKNEAAVPDKV